MISEVKDTRSHVLRTMENSEQKILLKCHLELNFNNFQERKIGNVLG